jgi:hypothetical protein
MQFSPFGIYLFKTPANKFETEEDQESVIKYVGRYVFVFNCLFFLVFLLMMM